MNKCIIDIPDCATVDEYEDFLHHYVLVMRLSAKRLKLTKYQKQIYEHLLNSILNAHYVEGI